MASYVANKNPNNFIRDGFRIETTMPYQKSGMISEAFLGPKKFRRMNSRDGLPNSFQGNQNNYKAIDAEEMDEIERFFNKKYEFKPPESDWHLPDADKMFSSERWQCEEMMKKKDELNKVKNKLNNFDLDSWHRHTRAMNKAGNVVKTIKNDMRGEMVTQAWCKFYEVCGTYNFVCDVAQEENFLNSLHLCEAPGGFITALNHYIQLNHPFMKWDWIATTLNPYYEGNPLSKTINDDRFILHTMDKWKFGEDYSGDLMDLENLRSLVKESRTMGPILMITADGSIDCRKDPGEQELTVCQLVYCEVVAALHILSIGGNFLVKMFTMYESETICLMYLLVCCFKSVNVYKPATSKEGNSEIYVVCLNYVGVDKIKPWLKKLLSRYTHSAPKEAMFSLDDIPKDFMDQQRECAEIFKNYQTEVIERNIFLYNLPNNQQSMKKMKRMSFLVAEEYVRRYRIRPIGPQNQIVGEEVLRMTEMPSLATKRNVGSFNDQQEQQKIRGLDKLKMLSEELKLTQMHWHYEEDIKWLELEQYSSGFKIAFGRPVTSVHCSKFCLQNVITMRNAIAELAEEIGQAPKKSDTTDSEVDMYSEELSSEIKNIIQKTNPVLLKKAKVMNFKEKLWMSLESGKNQDFERSVFFHVMDLIESLWRDESFILQGYPMLTQFTAGVVFMIGHLFQKVGFIRPIGQDFAVIFQNFRSWNIEMKHFLKKLDVEMENLGDDKSVLAVIPIREIVYGHNEFYSTVTAVNSLCVQEQNRELMNRMLSGNTNNSILMTPPPRQNGARSENGDVIVQ